MRPAHPSGQDQRRPLTIACGLEGDLGVVSLMGEIDIATGAQLDAAVNGLFSAGAERLLVDTRRVTFLDAYGLRSFVAARRRLRRIDDQVRLHLRGPGAYVARVLELSDLTAALPVYAG